MAKDPKTAKKNRVDEVGVLLEEFGKVHLTQEINTYVKRLWDQLARKRGCDITKGKKEIWASAVIYVIARLNFLFDKKSNNYLPMSKIFEYFSTKQGMVRTRATEIERICRITIGNEDLCSEDISDHLTFIQLPNGLVITKAMAKKEGII